MPGHMPPLCHIIFMKCHLIHRKCFKPKPFCIVFFLFITFIIFNFAWFKSHLRCFFLPLRLHIFEKEKDKNNFYGSYGKKLFYFLKKKSYFSRSKAGRGITNFYCGFGDDWRRFVSSRSQHGQGVVHQIVSPISNSESTNFCNEYLLWSSFSTGKLRKKNFFGPIRSLFPFSTAQT